MKNSRFGKSIVSLSLLSGSIVFSLVIIEIFLRIIGFSYKLSLDKIEFGFPDPEDRKTYFLIDRDLFWVTKDYYNKLEVARKNNPPIVFMGCSCTEWGRYDKHFTELILKEFPHNRISYANFGVTGWTTYQGLQQLKRDILSIKPKVVTIYYGWNDHWIAWSLEDKNIAKINSSLLFHVRRSSFVQLIVKAYIVLQQKKRLPERVSASDFRKNLSEMVKLAHDNGIIPVLLTAPTSNERGQEPAYLVKNFVRSLIRSLNELIPLHQRYISIVRDVAKDENVVLCDLAREFDMLPRKQVKNIYFEKDGIHLSDEGNKKIAEFLYDCFKQNDLLKVILE